MGRGIWWASRPKSSGFCKRNDWLPSVSLRLYSTNAGFFDVGFVSVSRNLPLARQTQYANISPDNHVLGFGRFLLSFHSLPHSQR